MLVTSLISTYERLLLQIDAKVCNGKFLFTAPFIHFDQILPDSFGVIGMENVKEKHSESAYGCRRS